jgi:hypothetical protein
MKTSLLPDKDFATMLVSGALDVDLANAVKVFSRAASFEKFQYIV